MFSQFIDIILHLNVHLNQWIELFGPWIYLVLFLVIFCETGLVVTPFLPGDSLLFALGALTTTEGAVLSLLPLSIILIVAAVLGNIVNYAIGRFFGEKIVGSRFIKKEHIEKTQHFYAKYGGKTIVFTRFMPIVRTFAPFVAGIGKMYYPRFLGYNIFGGVAWVLSFLLAGHFFGDLPQVKNNFHIVILAIIVLSLLPAFFEYIRAKRKSP